MACSFQRDEKSIEGVWNFSRRGSGLGLGYRWDDHSSEAAPSPPFASSVCYSAMKEDRPLKE